MYRIISPPIITTHPETRLIGHSLTMSLANDRTAMLWRGFMPHRKEIINAVGNILYSMQLYSEDYFANFNPATEFEKWAAVAVFNFDDVPEGMETFIIPKGKYAVFHYKGTPESGAEAFSYIFQQWLPQSEYLLDNRPHFELLGEKYKNNSPESEEEIWIPIR
jgi:AraC family transcriptional regulator